MTTNTQAASSGTDLDCTERADPIDQIRDLIDEGGPDVLSRIADILLGPEDARRASPQPVAPEQRGLLQRAYDRLVSIQRSYANSTGFTGWEEDPVLIDLKAALALQPVGEGEQARMLTPGMQNQANFRKSCERRGVEPTQELFQIWQDARALTQHPSAAPSGPTIAEVTQALDHHWLSGNVVARIEQLISEREQAIEGKHPIQIARGGAAPSAQIADAPKCQYPRCACDSKAQCAIEVAQIADDHAGDDLRRVRMMIQGDLLAAQRAGNELHAYLLTRLLSRFDGIVSGERATTPPSVSVQAGDERALFEAAWRAKFNMPADAPFAKWNDGSYTAPAINDYYDGWCMGRAAQQAATCQPVDMILLCPNCGKQHIDAPDERKVPAFGPGMDVEPWANPPHRSHLCHNPDCGHIWRPADVPTNGVAAIKTKGKADSPTCQGGAQQAGAPKGHSAYDIARSVRDACLKISAGFRCPESMSAAEGLFKVRNLTMRMDLAEVLAGLPAAAQQAGTPVEPLGYVEDYDLDRFKREGKPGDYLWLYAQPVPSAKAIRSVYTTPIPAAAQLDALDAARREAWLIANHRWSVRWRIHTKKQIEQWQMVDDGEPWGQWGDYRKVIDAARTAYPIVAIDAARTSKQENKQ